MARGFVKGMLWGTGCSLAALAVISMVDNGLFRDHEVTVSEQGAQRPGEVAQPAGRAGADGPSAVGLIAPDEPGPEPDTLAALLSEVMTPAAIPETGTAPALAGGASPDSPGGIAVLPEAAPRVAGGGGAGLESPSTEPALSISTEPAQPVAPVAVPQETAFADPQVKAPVSEAADRDAVRTDPAPTASVQPTVTTDIETPASPDVESGTSSLAGDRAQAPNPATPALPDAFASDAAPAEAEAEMPPSSQESSAPAPMTADTQVAALAPQVELSQGPRVDAISPEQPLPEVGFSEIARVPGAVQQAPSQAVPSDLEEPRPMTQDTQEGESASTRVRADLSVASVAAPETDEKAVSEFASVAQTITPVPDARGLAPLPAPSVKEAALAPDIAAPAQAPAAMADPEPQESAGQPVRVNRLPTLGAEQDNDEAPEEIAALPAPDNAEQTPQRPVDRYAVAFDNPEGKPLMAVVLMDDGVDMAAPATGLAALQALPYPVSFAVDALLPDAVKRMEAYREAGFEVLATVDLPPGAQATDAEVNLSVALEKLSRVIGVLDGVGEGIQTTPDAGRQVAQILAQTGHGLVTQNRGLNTVQKLAAREGVPSAVVFRDFDGKGQSSTVIRRFLDQAAFRAGQEGAVVMLGRLREETIAALVLWTLQDRSSSVAMAPVSAALGTD